jgi:hypothetical protein
MNNFCSSQVKDQRCSLGGNKLDLGTKKSIGGKHSHMVVMENRIIRLLLAGEVVDPAKKRTADLPDENAMLFYQDCLDL